MQKQETLQGGTVEDLEKGRRMFQMMAELFTRSIIGHTAWADTITEEQKQRIQIERLKQIKQANGEKITEATDYEAMVYISTASLATPLSHSWFNIYAFLFRKFYPKKVDQIFEKHEGQKLELIETRDLKKLKAWLYKVSKK